LVEYREFARRIRRHQVENILASYNTRFRNQSCEKRGQARFNVPARGLPLV